jgi:hypothetical protein
MIVSNLNAFQVEKTPCSLTSFAGLPLVLGLAHHLGLPQELDAIPGLKSRRRGYSVSDHLLALAMTLTAGGEALDDIELLRSDAGLREIVEGSFFPAPNTLGEFLRGFDQGSLWRLGEVSSKLVRRLISHRKLSSLTLDIDASLIESEKEEAQTTYKGFPGYDPLLAWIPELNCFLSGIFREGNASPQSHNLSLLKKCLRLLPKGLQLRFRSDSAAYQEKVVQECVDHGIAFAICADLDVSVVAAIARIPEKAWKIVHRGEDTFALAETVHAPFNNKHLPSFRLIVTRRITWQLELFKSPIKDHAILCSLPDAFSTEGSLDFYTARGTAEKWLGELKNGFGLAKLPCKEFLANAAYFQTSLLAYNLSSAFKLLCLPESWKNFTIKTLRYRLLGQAALVVRHARRLLLKLSESYPYFPVFEQARRSLFAPAPT